MRVRASELAGLRETPAARQQARSRPGWLAWLAIYSAILAGLVGWRWPIIDSPPYWDAAMGIFVEADFLLRSDFDYRRLWYDEPRFTDGGPAIYVISIMPTLLALLMLVAPSPAWVLVIYHLFCLACGAWVLTAMLALLAPRIGWPGALLSAGCVATTPPFNVQLDLLGMDLPMTAAAMLAVWLTARGRYLAGAAAGLLASLLKIHGALASAGMLFYLALLLASGWQRRDERFRRRVLVGLSANLAAIAVEILVGSWKQELPRSADEGYEFTLAIGLESMSMLRFWCPDVAALFVVWLLALGGAALWHFVSRWPGRSPSAWLDALAELHQPIERAAPTVIGLAIVLGTAGMLAIMYTIPRYLTLPLPFLYLGLAPIVLGPGGRRRWAALAFAAVIAGNLANLDGRFYPSIAFEERTGAMLERSREYLADHRANLAAVEAIVAQAAGRPIVAGNPMVHFLALPQLGYVAAPLEGYATNAFTTTTFRPVGQIFDDLPDAIVLVYLQNRFVPVAQCAIPKPSPDDAILFSAEGPSPLYVFAPAGPSAEGSPEARRQYYVDLLDPGRQYRRLAQRHLKQNELYAAAEMFERAVQIDRHDRDSFFQLARLRYALGDYDAAARHARQLVRLEPESLQSQFLLAEALAQSSRPEEALPLVERVLARDPRSVAAQRLLGNLSLRLGRQEAAVEHLAAAARLAPTDPSVRLELTAALAQGQAPDAALASLAELARLKLEGLDPARLAALVERLAPHASRPAELAALAALRLEGGDLLGAAADYRRAAAAAAVAGDRPEQIRYEQLAAQLDPQASAGK